MKKGSTRAAQQSRKMSPQKLVNGSQANVFLDCDCTCQRSFCNGTTFTRHSAEKS